MIDMKREMYKKIEKLEKENWWYKGRRKFIKKFLDKGDKKILEIGCGTGLNLELFRKMGYESFGVDIKISSLKEGEDKNILKGNAINLPFKEGGFNKVFILDVLEHIEKYEDVLKEVHRILEVGGEIYITVPAFNFLWGENDKLSEHKRRYTKNGIVNLLKKYNFSVKKAIYWNFFMFFPMLLYRFLYKFLTIDKIKGPSKNSLERIPETLNKFLEKVIEIENFLSRRLNFLFGTSVFVVAEVSK